MSALTYLRWCVDRAQIHIEASPDTAVRAFRRDLAAFGPNAEPLAQFDLAALTAAVSRGGEALKAAMIRLGLAEGAGWYLVIQPDGSSHAVNETVTPTAVSGAVRAYQREHFGAIELAGGVGAAGFINTRGGKADREFPPNVVGGSMLACAGGPLRRYGGPIVIAGWDPDSGAATRLRSLTFTQTRTLDWIAQDIRDVLDGCPTRRGEEWDEQIAKFAVFLAGACVDPPVS